VAVVVQEGVQKVFASFAEALRRESLRVTAEGSGGGVSTFRVCTVCCALFWALCCVLKSSVVILLPTFSWSEN